MRGKGEGAIYRVPADKSQPLKYWTAVVELPPGPNGERRRKPVRRKNKAEVVAELSRIRADLQTRGDLPTMSQTVEQWFTYWVEQVAAKDVRPNTLSGYRTSVYKHIIPAIGKLKLDKLTAAHIRRVHDAVTDKGLSSTTALLAHRTMSVSLKTALREGRIARNPATLTAPPRKARPKLQALELSEALQLMEYASTDAHIGAWIATVLLSGARRGEVIGLERDRVTDVLDLSWQIQRLKLTDTDGKPDAPVDYEYRHLTGGLYLTRPKSSKSWRIIPLVNPLREILERHIAATPDNPWGLVFTQRGRPIDPSVASAQWREALASAGLEKDVRLHDGRHTTVDLLLEAGVHIDVVMDIVGHSTRAQTNAYRSEQNRKRLVAAMQQFSELFTPPATGRTLEIGE